MLHDDDDVLDASDEVHGAAHSFDHFAGDHPVGEIAFFGDFHGAEDGDVHVTASDHGEGVGAGEIGGARDFGDGLFAGVDEIGIGFPFEGERSHAEHAVFGLEDDFDAFGDEVGDEGGDSDSEVDVVAILEFAGGSHGDLISGERHGVSLQVFGAGDGRAAVRFWGRRA